MTRGLHRSITGEPGAKLPSPGRLTAGVRSRAGRTCPGVGQTSSKDVKTGDGKGALRAGEEMSPEVVVTVVEVHSAVWTEEERLRAI